MAYFRELPNISYISRLPDVSSNEEYITVKNLFKRAKLRTDVVNIITAFNYYQVEDNQRPEVVASKLYNDPELDWVILITNNITNVREQWPLSNNDLYNYMLDKYGTEQSLSSIHHYETIEVKDEYDRLVVPSGLQVDSNFTVTYTKFDNTLSTISPVKQVTNYEYETDINEEKRKIRVLKPAYLSVVITDLRNIMKYDQSSQYLNQTTKQSYNPNLTGV
ncbi:MAG: baseplate wedge protein 53 [Nitrosarchaeum sp.]|nr:baseplate wedge protein 53 [Nitrosarchaeum sp.]